MFSGSDFVFNIFFIDLFLLVFRGISLWRTAFEVLLNLMTGSYFSEKICIAKGGKKKYP